MLHPVAVSVSPRCANVAFTNYTHPFIFKSHIVEFLSHGSKLTYMCLKTPSWSVQSQDVPTVQCLWAAPEQYSSLVGKNDTIAKTRAQIESEGWQAALD